MNQATPCPYCGNVGYHVWAGGGGCPGAAPERERDGAAAAALAALSEQNRLLRFALARHARLCTRAAEALENKQFNVVSRQDLDLIAELREAAPLK